MAEERISYVIDAKGGDATAAQFNRVSGSITATGLSAKTTAMHVSNMGSAVGAFGTVVAVANPQIGAFAGLIGTASGAVNALTASIGATGALAAAGLVAAVGTYVLVQKNAADATAEQTKELEKQRATVASLTAEYRKLGVSEREAEVLAIERQLSGIEGPLRFGERDRLQGLLALRKEALEDARVEEENAAALAEIARIEGAAFDSPGGARGGARKQQRGLFEQQFGADENRALAEGILSDAERAEDARFKKKLARINKEAKERQAIAKKEAAERERIEKAAAEKSIALEQERQQVMIGAFQVVGSAGIQAFADMAKGQKVALAEVLAGIGDTMVAEGTRWLFSGLATAWMGDPRGLALAKIGTAEIAAGIALGAASSGSGAASGAGGGGASAPAEPTRFRTTADGSGGTQTVNINMPTVISPTAEDGRRVEQALAEKNRHFGRSRRAA